MRYFDYITAGNWWFVKKHAKSADTNIVFQLNNRQNQFWRYTVNVKFSCMDYSTKYLLNANLWTNYWADAVKSYHSLLMVMFHNDLWVVVMKNCCFCCFFHMGGSTTHKGHMGGSTTHKAIFPHFWNFENKQCSLTHKKSSTYPNLIIRLYLKSLRSLFCEYITLFIWIILLRELRLLKVYGWFYHPYGSPSGIDIL